MVTAAKGPDRVPDRDAVAYTLEYQDGSDDKQHNLAAGTTVIGRAGSCDLVINDTSVSRRHAQLAVNNGSCVVTDLGSRNGTFLNGDQIETAELHDGDRLVLGEIQLKLRVKASSNFIVTDDDAALMAGVIKRPVGPDSAEAAAGTVTVDAPRLLKMLTDISRTLVGTQPIDEVLGHVVDSAFESTQATRALLMLYDEEARVLVPRVVRHREGARGSTRISRTILDQVLKDRVSMLALNAQLDPRLDMSQSIRTLDIRSFMCAPLWHEQEVIGVLYVDNPQGAKFTTEDLDLFTAFSNYAAVAIAQARLAARVLEETKRRERLQRYHSPAVVDRILKSGSEADAPMIAHERDLTVLFADLVGFTTMAEGMQPQQVAVLLNAFFTRMADAIFQHDGTLDKFIGDSVLAIFGAPMDLPNHALNAVQTAQTMRRALKSLNEERPDAMLKMRVAIHTGVALVGDMGSPKRREYSVLGDVVNTAARIEESVAGAGQIVISRATFDRLAGQIPAVSLGPVALRGRSEPVEMFEIPPD
jgi:adenylate cyclase